MPLPVPRLKRVALAMAVAGSLAAVTAFGVDPLDVAGLSEPVTVTEPLSLSPEVAEHSDSYLHSELIRRGDTLAIVMARAGANDAEFLRFANTDATARRALVLRPGRSLRIELDSLGRVQRLAYRSTLRRLPPCRSGRQAPGHLPSQLGLQHP